MKKNILNILTILLLATLPAVSAFGYSTNDYPVSDMQSTSSMRTNTSSSAQTYKKVEETTHPGYVPAASGDMNPFGASSRSGSGPHYAPPGHTGGDKDTPNVEGPMPDGTLCLLLMAVVAAGVVAVRRRRMTQATTIE